MKIDDILGKDREAQSLIVSIGKLPTDNEPRLLCESALQSLEEGTIKQHGQYRYRLDRRPGHHGGDQVHIYGKNNRAWAYRYNGDRSEPNKYTLAANDTVKDIVSDVFGVPRDIIESLVVKDEKNGSLLIEVNFA